MSDPIDRQAALDIYDDYNVAVENGELEAYRKHRERLLELPSAQPWWIPCSTELPKESGTYLVTISYKDGSSDDTDLIRYNSHWREWNEGEPFGGKVIAWQPKPEPWEGGQDEN